MITPRQAPTESTPPPTEEASFLPGKLLVVDDEAAVRQTIVDILRHDGYEVREAADGRAALDCLEHDNFAVVITDIVMPHLDGLSLIRLARERGYQAAYILMTGYSEWDVAVEAMKLGAADYLPKPFPLELLRLVVRRALEAQRVVARAQEAAIYEKLAHTDGLTEVYNHRFFQQLLHVEINRARRFNRSLALIMLDLDHFKDYNDMYGHQVGDQALRQLADLLRRSSRAYDLVARYGGDEFAVILPETTAPLAVEVAERIRLGVEVAPAPSGLPLPGGRFTVSQGIAGFPDDAAEQSALIRKADLALYHAKSTGRNRLCRYDALLG